MTKKAWQRERELRDSAVPMDRRIHDSNWWDSDFSVPFGDDLLKMFWQANVPGSGAPEIPYQEMIQAAGNKGADVSKAEEMLDLGLELFRNGNIPELRKLTAALMAALYTAPQDPNHSYYTFSHPAEWAKVRAAMGPVSTALPKEWVADFEQRIYQGWIGQLAGGSFGTAIEGYTGKQISKVYGLVDYYITEPETVNDDVVYELIFLDVFERLGRQITSEEIGLEWVKQITFGWSAEWVALRNLNLGILPPQSGSWFNPYSDWIGAQMRGMICGLLSPAWPLEAARLAHIDGVVSHSANGVYGEMYAAVMTALAFDHNDPREIILEGLNYLPQGSEYVFLLQKVIGILKNEENPVKAWEKIEPNYERYNWIHAYPNAAADVFALWYGEGDFTRTMAYLAQAGHDVDCNAGLVGTILGVISPVPEKWAGPIGDFLETYIKGKEKILITTLAEDTARLAKRGWGTV